MLIFRAWVTYGCTCFDTSFYRVHSVRWTWKWASGPHEFIRNFKFASKYLCNLNSPKNVTCQSDKLRTEFTSLMAKSRRTRLSGTTFYAWWNKWLCMCNSIFKLFTPRTWNIWAGLYMLANLMHEQQPLQGSYKKMHPFFKDFSRFTDCTKMHIPSLF